MAQADLHRQLEFLMQQQRHLLHLVGFQDPATLHGGTRTPAETFQSAEQSLPIPPTTASLQPLDFFPSSKRITPDNEAPAAAPENRVDAETVPDLNAAVSGDDIPGMGTDNSTPREGASGAITDADRHGVHVSEGAKILCTTQTAGCDLYTSVSTHANISAAIS